MDKKKAPDRFDQNLQWEDWACMVGFIAAAAWIVYGAVMAIRTLVHSLSWPS